ncbi:MAG: FKBP-type peptidyl-prolyl cis-trans isomerase [Flavobacteriales bacterium]|nr:FKBP-type peptidyl-prolyl cis-trans isomerase [Flavobacteriales bacterium]
MRFILIVFTVLGIVSCAKHKTKKQAKIDDEVIRNYLEDNNISATETGSGLYYVIDSSTNGAMPDPDGYVTVAYKGYFTDGSVFDQSGGANFSLTSVISGWREGIPLFPEGSKGTLFVPSHLGYGLHDYGDIPGKSVLIFDVTIIDVP